jgi:hypothetical protein
VEAAQVVVAHSSQKILREVCMNPKSVCLIEHTTIFSSKSPAYHGHSISEPKDRIEIHGHREEFL